LTRTRWIVSAGGVLLLSGLLGGCSARFYGGTKLPPDRLIRLAGDPALHEVRINNTPMGLFQPPQSWILLPGEHVISAKYASARGWGGDKPMVMEFVGKPGHSYVLRAEVTDSSAVANGPPGVLKSPSKLVKWKMWVEDVETHERLEEE